MKHLISTSLFLFLLTPWLGTAQVVPISFLGKPVQVPTADGPIITSGLVVNLDAGNKVSYSGTGTTWTDLSGNGNHATLQNGVSYNSGNGGYLRFDGVDDMVASLNLSSYTNFTLEIWIYDTRNNGERDILSYNGNAGSYTFNGSSFRTDGNNLGGRSYGTVGQPPLNTWYRFCITKGSNVFINQTKHTGSGNENPYGTLNFGGTRSDVNSRLNGRIAIVRIYNRKLTDLEIQQNYDALKSRFGL